MAGDEFVLYDLRVVVESVGEQCTCNMSVGDSFEVRGGKLSLPAGQPFCLYALQSAIPLLPAKQRPLQAADWMATDARITCPDPYCRLIMRIDRVRQHTFRHSETSAVEMPSDAAKSS